MYYFLCQLYVSVFGLKLVCRRQRSDNQATLTGFIPDEIKNPNTTTVHLIPVNDSYIPWRGTGGNHQARAQRIERISSLKQTRSVNIRKRGFLFSQLSCHSIRKNSLK